jgi:dTDP-4-amino-4,6-dideoxygalactose transaminase
MVKFLDLHHQYLSMKDEMDAAISNVIAKSSFIGGPDVKQFEEEFSAYQNAEHCIGVANGTDAIEIIIEAFGFPPGSEIIVPANSFISSAEAVTRNGCKVIFADVDPLTYTLCIKDLERRVTPRTVAVMAVHLYGQPVNFDYLIAVCKRYDLKIIEDCAQAHGAEYNGKRIGAIGSAGSFSFYPGKNLGAYGDGGAIVTNDSALAEKCRMIANHGRLDKYNHLFEGRNSRLDGLQAAVLRVKLKRLDGWVDRRNEIAAKYIDGLSGIPDLVLPAVRADTRHAFHLFVVRTSQRDALREYLTTAGIEVGVHYPIALPKLRAFDYLGQGTEPMFANGADQELLSLPMGEHLSDDDVKTVVNTVRYFSGFASANL